METLLLGLFYIFSLYAFIPGLLSRLFGFRVFKKGIAEHEFALTFDDGPDPVYTPMLLDLLKKYDAKATFFVVGSSAEKNPEVIRRIHNEGHLLGIHNYKHHTNWLMGPKTVNRHVSMTAKIIKDVTGQEAHYYRPPWGIVNLFDFTKRNDFQLVLWSGMFKDWRMKTGVDRLTQRMVTKLRGGEVFVLHDCGTTLGADEEAPLAMLEALERVLEEAKRRGLSSITIEDLIKRTAEFKHSTIITSEKLHAAEKGGKVVLPWYKRVLVTLWLLWEKLFHLMFRLQSAGENEPMFHFRKIRYSGKPIVMNGGITLEKGDPVLEMHFDNKKLFEYGSKAKSSVHLAIQLVRQTEKSLPQIAEFIEQHPEFSQVKALYGITMINRGPEQFGFTIADMPSGWFAKSTTFYLRLLMSVIHPNGRERVKEHQDQMVPKIIVIPTSVLLEMYGKEGTKRRPAVKPAVQQEQRYQEIEPLEAGLPC